MPAGYPPLLVYTYTNHFHSPTERDVVNHLLCEAAIISNHYSHYKFIAGFTATDSSQLNELERLGEKQFPSIESTCRRGVRKIVPGRLYKIVDLLYNANC